MNSSFSEEILQKMRLYHKKSQFIHNPQKMLTNSFTVKTQYISNNQSPTHLNYNQIIHDGQTRMKGRYKLRNCRQPNLKIVERKIISRQRPNSLLGLKQLMKQQIQKYSIKKRYDSALQKCMDHQIAESLKLDLLFLPNTVKIPHRNRYRPNKQVMPLSNSILVSGSKIIENKQIPKKDLKQKKNQQGNQQNSSKKTAGYEIKFRRYYLHKNNHQYDIKTQQQFRVNKKTADLINLKEEQFIPLTGWL